MIGEEGPVSQFRHLGGFTSCECRLSQAASAQMQLDHTICTPQNTFFKGVESKNSLGGDLTCGKKWWPRGAFQKDALIIQTAVLMLEYLSEIQHNVPGTHFTHKYCKSNRQMQQNIWSVYPKALAGNY